MKRVLIICSVMLCLVMLGIAGSDAVNFYNATVATNGTEIVTNMATLTTPAKVSGEVESVFIDFTSGSSFTGTVAIATTTDGPLNQARTIYSASLSADGESAPRISIANTSGTDIGLETNGSARIQLLSDVLTMTTSSFNQGTTSNIALNVYLILK